MWKRFGVWGKEGLGLHVEEIVGIGEESTGQGKGRRRKGSRRGKGKGRAEDEPGRIDSEAMLLPRRDLHDMLPVQLLDVDYRNVMIRKNDTHTQI
jgi:hypothetical protein